MGGNARRAPRYMRRRVRDEHLADDLAQDVLLKAQKGLRDRPDGDKLAAWMFQIARNTVIDFYRSRRSDAAAHRARAGGGRSVAGG